MDTARGVLVLLHHVKKINVILDDRWVVCPELVDFPNFDRFRKLVSNHGLVVGFGNLVKDRLVSLGNWEMVNNLVSLGRAVGQQKLVRSEQLIAGSGTILMPVS